MPKNFNTDPYFDSFDSKKNHQSVLFKPEVPVQVRELNELQSIQSNQRKQLASKIFKDGSRVSNGSVSLTEMHWVKLSSQNIFDIDPNAPKNMGKYLEEGKRLFGKFSGVEATIINFDGDESEPMLYVAYTKAGRKGVKKITDPVTNTVTYETYGEGEQLSFIDGEDLWFIHEGNEPEDYTDTAISNGTVKVPYKLKVECPACIPPNPNQGSVNPDNTSKLTSKSTGFGAKQITVAEGTYYWQGYFIENPKSVIIFSKDGKNLTDINTKIGFDIVERVVTSNDDPTLYDNALGYPNERASGADRYVIELSLVQRTLSDADGTQFIKLAEVTNGNVKLLKSDLEWSSIGDEMARRTFEESGHYTVTPFDLDYKEIVKKYDDDPNGIFDASVATEKGNVSGLKPEDHVSAQITNGLAYVKGYRHSNQSDTFLTVPKARVSLDLEERTSFVEEISSITVILHKDAPKNLISTSSSTMSGKKIYFNRVEFAERTNAGYLYDDIDRKPYTFEVDDLIPNSTSIQNTISHPTQPYIASAYLVDTVKVSDFQYDYYEEDNGNWVKKTNTNGDYEVFKLYYTGFEFVDHTTKYGLGDINNITASASTNLSDITTSFIGFPAFNDYKTDVAQAPTVTKSYNSIEFKNAESNSMYVKVDNNTTNSLRQLNDSGVISDDKGSVFITTTAVLTAPVTGDKAIIDITGSTVEVASAQVYTKDTTTWDYLDAPNIYTDNGGTELVVEGVSGKSQVKVYISRTQINAKDATKTIEDSDWIRFTFNGIGSKCSYADTTLVDGMFDSFEIIDYALTTDLATDTSSSLAQEGTFWDLFDFDNGVKPYAYTQFNIISKSNPKVEMNPDAKSVWVKVKYFKHGDDGGFFTIDSYKKLLDDGVLSYENLPVVDYKGVSTSVANIIDFRPRIFEVDGDSEVNGTMSIPKFNHSITYNLKAYLPRKDYLCIDKDGVIYQAQGVPAEKPEYPLLNENVMPLYEVYMPAWTFSVDDIKATEIDNKRFTMRDIGKLASRIDNLEYYTTLTLLEQSVADTKIEGDAFWESDKLKNGFLADNFTTYERSDVENFEYSAMKDAKDSLLRPLATSFNEKLILTETQGDTSNLGDVVTLKYDTEVANEQPYATKYVSVNECLVFKREGILMLTPNHNTWSDTTMEPKKTWDIDTGVDAYKKLLKAVNVNVGDFSDIPQLNKSMHGNLRTIYSTDVKVENINSTVATGTQYTRNKTGRMVNGVREWRSQEVSTTTDTTIERTTKIRNQTVQKRQVGVAGETTSYSTTYATGATLLPYMEETRFEFMATGLTENTKFYLFFDGKDVTQFAVTATGDTQKGGLYSDDKGNLQGTSVIPSGKFFNGTKEVKLTTDFTNSGDDDLEFCVAKAQFWSGGIDVSKQELTLNVTSPVANEHWETVSDGAVSVDVKDKVLSSTTRTVTSNTKVYLYDPVAQSFTLDKDCMITDIDLYFFTVDPSGKNNFVEIREMTNGYPSKSVLGKAKFNNDVIKVSEDATVETNIAFPIPVYIQKGVEYCFVVGGDSPKTRVFVAELGKKAINMPNKIVDTQPQIGSRFRSQNGSTWNAEQFEDIMYKINVAKFTSDEFTLKFKATPSKRPIKLVDEPFFVDSTQPSIVKVTCSEPHGLRKDDKVIIQTRSEFEIEVKALDGAIRPDDVIQIGINADDTAIVKRSEFISSNGTTSNIKLTLTNYKGGIQPLGAFVKVVDKKPMRLGANTKEWLDKVGGNVDSSGGTIWWDINDKPKGILNSELKDSNFAGSVVGFDFDKFNNEYSVLEIEGINEFSLYINGVSANSGGQYFGGNTCIVYATRKYDMFTVSGSLLSYDGSESWKGGMTAYGYNNTEGATNNTTDKAIKFDNIQRNVIHQLPTPCILKNEYIDDEGVFSVEATFTKNPNNDYISPVVNSDTMNVTLTSNWIGNDDANLNSQRANKFIKKEENKKLTEVGEEYFKHITITAGLDKPSTGFKIIADISCPQGSSVDFYIKVSDKSGSDVSDLEWVQVPFKDRFTTELGEYSEYDCYINKHKIRDYGVKLDTSTGAYVATTNDEHSIVGAELMNNISSKLMKGFDGFKIKVIGKAINSAQPPIIKNLRVIAVA